MDPEILAKARLPSLGIPIGLHAGAW